MPDSPDKWALLEAEARRLVDTQAHMLPSVRVSAADALELVAAVRRAERLSDGRDAAILEGRRLREVLAATRGAAAVLAASAECVCVTGYRCARCTILEAEEE